MQLFIFLLFLTATCAPPPLTVERHREAVVVYEKAREAIDSCNLEALNEAFSTGGEKLSQLFYYYRHSSLLCHVIFKSNCPDAISVIAKYGLEMGSSPKLLTELNDYCKKGPPANNVSLSVFELLLDQGFVIPEDLWFCAIHRDDRDLWNLIRAMKANVNHRIPGHYIYTTVLYECLKASKLDLFKELFDAGADVNSPPIERSINIWQFSVYKSLKFPYLKEMAARTADLFSFMKQILFQKSDHRDDLDEIISEELLKRDREGRLNLLELEQDSSLDLAMFKIPGQFPKTVQTLQSFGLKSQYPLSFAFLSRNWTAVQTIIETGQANFNEKVFNSSLLLCAIKSPQMTLEDVQLVIDRIPATETICTFSLTHLFIRFQNPPIALVRDLAVRLPDRILINHINNHEQYRIGTKYIEVLREVLNRRSRM